MANRGAIIEAPALPEHIADWRRHIKAERSLNDTVEDIHRILVEESELYRKYLRAVDDRQAVTGSLSFDNCKACEMIMAKAQQLGYLLEVPDPDPNSGKETKPALLADINAALGVVLRRYRMSRKQRRNELRGVQVAADDNGD